MRSYPRNSPEAAARIVALVLIADGNVSRSECDVLNRMDGPRELGLEPEGLQRIVQTLCEDLLMGHNGSGSLLGGVDDSAMASLMAEVDDSVLQRKVLQLPIAAAHTDKHIADGEALALAAARLHWRVGGGEQAAGLLPIAPQAA